MDNEINLNKVVEKSKQWTLEGDCTLLQWMNQISNNLEERVNKTSSALNEMSIKLDRTSVALSNATNNLAALQYSKFVENRVHDEDETLVNPPAVLSEDTTDNKPSGQDIYSFLKKNLEMMNSCHEAYSISYEDSDDDEDDEPVTNVVYRSKNPYEARPLPHIYGSTLWKEKWHIGLCDSDNDFSGDENSEQFSESSSTADDSYESTAPTMSEWDSTAWGLNTQHNSSERRDIRTPSNDGESSYQGDEYFQSKSSTPRTQATVSIPNQQQQQSIPDQRYYHHVPRQQGNLFDDHDIFNESKPQVLPSPVNVSSPVVVPSQVVPPQQQKKIITESYIPNEPPPDEESSEGGNNRRHGAKKTLNLFDDDEFSSFMDQIVQKATNKNTNSNEEPQNNPKPPKPSVAPNLFSDPIPPPLDEGLQKQTKKTEVSPNLFDEPNIRGKKPDIQPVTQNLFSDSNDLFDSRGPQETKSTQKKTIAPNLFDDSDDLFGSKTNEPPVLVKRRSSSPKMEQEEEDMFPPSPKPTASVIGKTKIKNLFDDDDDDDDFDSIFSPKTSKTFSQTTKNLFTDELAKETDIQKKEMPTTENDLFDDGESTPNLQEEESPTVQSDKIDVPIETNKVFTNLLESSSKVGSLLKKGLFDDFDDLEDEDDIFSNKMTKKDSFENLFEKKTPEKKLTVIPSKTLFGDDDEEEDVKDPEESTSNTTNDKLPKSSIVENSEIKTSPAGDIFADKVDDDFDDFISTNSEKSDKVNEVPKDVPTSSPKQSEALLPLTTQELPQIKPAIAANLPIILQKPSIDKASKPKILPKKITKADLPEDVSKSTPSQQNTSTLSEDFRKISVESLKDPQLPGTSDSKTIENKNDSKAKHEEPEILPTSIETDKPTTPTKVEDLKPTPKPKPSIVVEYEKPSSPIESHPIHKSEKKPSTIPSYTSLFHDDVPPEDEYSNSTSNYESPMHTVDDDVEVKPRSTALASSSVNYNSLDLFTDVPPDDDFPSATSPVTPSATTSTEDTQTKRIHSIFYDDFHETIEAGRELNAPTSSYMINDEPPPDDRDSNKPVVSEIIKAKPQVSKLKKLDLQINVGALLPSAKIPSFKKPPVVEKPENPPEVKSSIEKDSMPSEELPRQEIKTRELPENILPNLNRDRAKVQVKRRPSTRTGRQERYRQSMIEDANSLEESETDHDTKATETSKNLDSKKSDDNEAMKSSLFDDFKPKQNKESGSTGFVNQMPDEATLFKESDNIFEKEVLSGFVNESTPFKEPENLFEKQVPSYFINQMPNEATLFEESDNLFNKKVSSVSSSSKAQITKIPSLFNDSDSEQENIFETMKSVKSSTTKSPVTKNIDSLFDSDKVDENPFGTPKNFLPAKEVNKPIVEEKKPPAIETPPVKSAFKEPQTNKTSKQTSSLFDDSDDGSDDLFAKKTTGSSNKPANTQIQKKPQENKPKNKPAKASTSLFSSDEGDGSGDDIFGKAKTTKIVKKKVEANVKEKSSSSNLFDDLSDDDSDGLFGSTTKKPSLNLNKPKPTNRTQSIKQTAQAQPAKAISSSSSSNPLADLLGP